MSASSVDLLRRLGRGSALGASPASGSCSGRPDGVDFAALLEQARSGLTESAIPVTVDGQAKVELSDEQLARVGQAADRAQAEGLTTALVLIDGQALTLDVGARRITGKVDPARAGALARIDGVVTAPGTGEAGAAGDAGAGGELTRGQLLGRLAGSGGTGR